MRSSSKLAAQGCLASVLFCTLASLAVGEDAAPRPDPRPNIVLVTFESLRASHVGAYGYPRNTTPSLDALAAQGVLFERAYAVTSWTLTSHASLFTGLYPGAHGVVLPKQKLGDSHTTLAEMLAEQGYQTAGFATGPFLRRLYNLDQGFELYDDSAANLYPAAAHSDVANPQLELAVARFLTEKRDPARPFLLFIYVWDPHYDYLPPPPFDARFVREGDVEIDVRGYEESDTVHAGISAQELSYVVSQYDGEIAATDAMLGRVFALLKDLGLWDTTAVVVTGDHGEEFFEHGTKGHKNNLHVESVEVPLIAKLPGAAPRRETSVVSLVDVLPTLIELAGLEAPPYLQGRSLLEPVREDAPAFFELVTTHYLADEATGQKQRESRQWVAVLADDHKLIGEPAAKRWLLYDLERDAGEQAPLGPDHDARRSALRQMLVRHTRATAKLAERWPAAPPVELSPADVERLRALGYLE